MFAVFLACTLPSTVTLQPLEGRSDGPFVSPVLHPLASEPELAA